jgi:hypothetical protein
VELRAINLRKDAIIAQLDAAYNKYGTAETSGDRRALVPCVNGIVKGDRIRIKNKVKKPATWTSRVDWSAEKERIATVTRVTPSQVHYITDNGVKTWRAPNNVEKLVV